MRLSKLAVFVFLCSQFLLTATVQEPEKLKPPLTQEIAAAWLIPDIRLDTGDTPGASASIYPQITCSGDDVYVIWRDTRNGNGDIYFNHSADRGATWQADATRLDTGDTPGTNDSISPRITCSGDDVYVIWRDTRNGNGDIYFNHSADRGANWQASDTRLDTGDTPGANDSLYPQITCSGDHVYVTWNEDRNGFPDIYFNHSADRGATWQAAASRLDSGDNPRLYPQITCSGDHVYVTWLDLRNRNPDIYFNHSADNGATWQASDIRLDTGDTPGANLSWNQQITCDGDHVYVTWFDDRNGALDIYCNHSADRGATWQADATRLDTGDTAGANDSGYPQITCSGDDVVVTWVDNRNGNLDIYANYSTDNGATWQASDIRLDTGDTPGANLSFNPQITCSGDHVVVTWLDDRNGNPDIYFNHSADNGASWQAAATRLDTGDDPGTSYSIDPQISFCGDHVVVTWQDSRNGYDDIYFNTTNTAPKAEAGMDMTLRTGTPCTLDGSASSDPDGDALTFLWRLLQKPSSSGATLSAAHSARASFTPDHPGEYQFRLTVTDAFGESDADRVVVTANALVELTLTCGTGGSVTPAPGTYTYDKGETVVLTAMADSGFVFDGWSGDARGTANPLTVVMDDDKTIGAGFTALMYAPTNLTGERIENRSLSMAEYIARLTWSAHPDNINITGYRIARLEGNGEVTLGVVNASTFMFEEAGVAESGNLTYHVYAVRGDGYESDPAVVTIH